MRSVASALLGAGARPVSSLAVAQDKFQFSIATGGTGGVYYPLGGGMAAVLSKYVPGHAGHRRSHRRLGRQPAADRHRQALHRVDHGRRGLDALKGQDKFTGKPVPVRTLMVLYPNRMHVVTIEGTGITKMADLKGKRVSTGSGGSATEVMAFRVIEAAGLDKDKDMKRERLGVAESVNALKDRKIDAFFWVGGLPTAAVTDLANSPGVKIKMIDHADLVAAMNKKYGNLYVKDVDPARTTYKGMDADNQQRHGDEPAGRAREHGRGDRLQHREDGLRPARRPDPRAQGGGELQAREPEDRGVRRFPWHPGAIKYFAEKGVKLK